MKHRDKPKRLTKKIQKFKSYENKKQYVSAKF